MIATRQPAVYCQVLTPRYVYTRTGHPIRVWDKKIRVRYGTGPLLLILYLRTWVRHIYVGVVSCIDYLDFPGQFLAL